jgi:hypothetical protein
LYALPIGTFVYYQPSGNSYITTGNVYGVNFTDSSVQANVSFAFTGNTQTIATMQVLGSISNYNMLAVAILSGTPVYPPGRYDDFGFDTGGFDNTTNAIYINGALVLGNYISNVNIIGKVNANGRSVLGIGTTVYQSNVWYSPGPGTPAAGTGLYSSYTVQANFLKASPGITPAAGQTP